MKTLTAQQLALYLGQECQTPHRGYKPEGGKSFKKCGKIMDIDLVIDQVGVWLPENAKTDLTNFKVEDVKPILRRLETITHTQLKEMGFGEWVSIENWIEDYCHQGQIEITDFFPSQFVYLLSKGFDIFGWIHEGLAIDRDTLKQ